MFWLLEYVARVFILLQITRLLKGLDILILKGLDKVLHIERCWKFIKNWEIF